MHAPRVLVVFCLLYAACIALPSMAQVPITPVAGHVNLTELPNGIKEVTSYSPSGSFHVVFQADGEIRQFIDPAGCECPLDVFEATFR